MQSNATTSSITKKKGGARPNMNMNMKILLAIASGALILMWYRNIQAMNSIQDELITENDPNRKRRRTDNISFPYIINKKKKGKEPTRTERQPENELDKVAALQPGEKSRHDESHDSISLSTLKPNNVAMSSKSMSPYAYAWVIGGIHEDRPAYKGFMWTIFVSAHLLEKLGTTADFWVFVRLSPESKLDDLPSEDRKVLEALGFNIVLLDKPKKESFAQLVYDKFLTINMTDYRRVMFLDADMIPLTGLDFYFHLSDPEYTKVPTLLKPNFIIASREEPCNTGMFMVEPSKEAFEVYTEIVRKQHEEAKSLPYPYFDVEHGWGHKFLKSDFWEGITKKGTYWKFHAAHSDQGLMYYYAKYARKEVSIVIGDRVQNWKAGKGDLPELESDKHGVLQAYQGEVLRYQFLCDKPQDEARRLNQDDFLWMCSPPYASVAHFMGTAKPWKRKFNFMRATDSSFRRFGARFLWFKELAEASDKYEIGLDIKHWNEVHLESVRGDLLGEKAEYHDQVDVVGIEARNATST